MIRVSLSLSVFAMLLSLGASSSWAACDGFDFANKVNADCGAITDVGCCTGTSVVWCSTVEGEGLCVFECAAEEATCGWDATNEFFDCNATDTVPEGTTMECGEFTCTADCVDRTCGPDGCGGNCGECTGTTVCDFETMACIEEEIEGDVVSEDTILESDVTEGEDLTGIEDDSIEFGEDVPVALGDTIANEDTTAGGTDTTADVGGTTGETTKKKSSGCSMSPNAGSAALALLLGLMLVPAILRRRYN